MKAVLIDPFTRTVSVVDYKEADNNLAEWYALMDCHTIDMRSIGRHPKHEPTQLSLVCDDEGLYRCGSRQRFFKLVGFPHMLAGKVLIVATRGPDTVDLPDPEVIARMLDLGGLVKWQDERLRFDDMTTTTEENADTPYGPATRLVMTPHFYLADDEQVKVENEAFAAGQAAGNAVMDQLEASGTIEAMRNMKGPKH